MKLPLTAWLREVAVPSPDSEPLSALREPTLMFGNRGLILREQRREGRREAERGQVEALADAPFGEFLRGDAVAELQDQAWG